MFFRFFSLPPAFTAITCLRLTEVRIPNHTIRHTDVRLDCHYDLDGEALYSVKFYKDGNEFYRFVPRDIPPVLIFDQPGVAVDVSTFIEQEEKHTSSFSHVLIIVILIAIHFNHLRLLYLPHPSPFLQLTNSTDTSVALRNVTLQSSGRYRCEVSAEAPSFQTVSDHGDMVVVAVPDEGPKITGGLPRYQIGDWVNVTCTSGRSKPATQLSWYINGEPVTERSLLAVHPPLVTGREGLETSRLGLKFPVRHKHFRNGEIKLKVSWGWVK